LGAAQGIRLADPGGGGGLGTILDKISIPAHLTAAAVWTPIGTEGMIQTMMYGDRYGPSRSDLYSTSLMAPIEAGAIKRIRYPKRRRCC
jgi:hypothetical protein